MAKDIYHRVVKEALIKDGWSITHDPYFINRLNKKAFEVDLGGEKIIGAERGVEKIAVEIKSFLGTSLTYDFHAAFGQYSVYRFFMSDKDAERNLFLAVTEEVFDAFFSDIEIEKICAHFNVEIIIFDTSKIEIVKWIKR